MSPFEQAILELAKSAGVGGAKLVYVWLLLDKVFVPLLVAATCLVVVFVTAKLIGGAYCNDEHTGWNREKEDLNTQLSYSRKAFKELSRETISLCEEFSLTQRVATAYPRYSKIRHVLQEGGFIA